MAKVSEEAFKSSFINRKADLEIDKLFRACVKLKASDLHLKVDKAPMVRVDGTLRPASAWGCTVAHPPKSETARRPASARTRENERFMEELRSKEELTKAHRRTPPFGSSGTEAERGT